MARDPHRAPDRHEVDVAYVDDPNYQQIGQIMASLEGLSEGRLPLYVTGIPEENILYAPEARADGRSGSGACEILSSASCRKCELSLKLKRLARQMLASHRLLIADALEEWQEASRDDDA